MKKEKRLSSANPVVVFTTITLWLWGCSATTVLTPVGNITYEPSLAPVIAVDASGQEIGLAIGDGALQAGQGVYTNTDQNLKNLSSISNRFLPAPMTIPEERALQSYRGAAPESAAFHLIQDVSSEPQDYIPSRNSALAKQKELTLLTMCVYGEARSEPYEGKLAIAYVVINRAAEGGWYGDTIRDVLLKPYQFTCFDPRDPNYKKLFNPKKNLWNQCFKAAWNAYSSLNLDPTEGANHYCRTELSPPWIRAMQERGVIGNHKFFLYSPQAMSDWWLTYYSSEEHWSEMLARREWRPEFMKMNALFGIRRPFIHPAPYIGIPRSEDSPEKAI